MKLKILRWIALILGSLANIWNLLVVIFIGANLINDLSGDESWSDIGINVVIFLILILCLVSIIIAWFKSKIGGFFLTISAIIALILLLINEIDRFLWSYDVILIQGVLILSGLLLLFYVYFNQRVGKKENT